MGLYHPTFGQLRPQQRFSDLEYITTRRLVALQPARFAFCNLCINKCSCLPATAATACLLAYRDSVCAFLPGSLHAPRIPYDPASPPAALARPATAVPCRANVTAAASFHAEMGFQHTFAATAGPHDPRTPPPGHRAAHRHSPRRSRRLRRPAAPPGSSTTSLFAGLHPWCCSGKRSC